MIWTLLSLGIIAGLILGMILAARLADRSSHHSPDMERLGNCRRGAIRLH